MNRLPGLFAMVAAVSLVSACTDYSTGTGYEPGTLQVRLHTPHADDGAVLLEISGPAIESVTANGALQLFTRRDGTTIVAAIVGELANGTVATVRVPYAATSADYTARVLEVADRDDGLRGSLAGYALTVEP